jgi:hypothetical protein
MLNLHATMAPQPSNAYDDGHEDSGKGDDDQCLCSALHRACSQIPGVRLEDIQNLISNNVALLQIRDPVDQWLPLHRLCRRQPSLPVIQLVVESWPDSVRQWTADKALPVRLPIHLACQYGASLSVIQYLARCDPQTLVVPTSYRQHTALDYARDYYQRWKTSADGSEKETQNESDHHSPLEVIEWLVQQQQSSPSSSSSSSSICTDNKASFHSTLTMSTVAESDCCCDGPETSSPKVLARRKQEQPPPPTLSRKNNSQPPKKVLLLPLSLSLRTAKKEQKQVQKQQQALQDAVQKLQAACWEEPPCLQNISKLVQACPQAVREARTAHGDYTLLHQICWNASGSIAALLLLLQQQQPQQQPPQGNNNTCNVGILLRIITCLIQAWPESVQQTTSAGYLPLHLLISGCSSKRAVERLASCCRDGAGGPSSSPTTRTMAARIDSSTTSTRRSDDRSDETALVQLVNFLVGQNPAGLLQPAHVDGFLPLHCATHCGAPLSVVQALVKALPKTLHIHAAKNIAVMVKEDTDIAANRESAENTSPLALAHQSIMGDMTKRPDVIAWLTTRLQEAQKGQHLQRPEQQQEQQQQAAIAAVATEQRELPRLQEENDQQHQQQQQQQYNRSAEAPAEEDMSRDLSCLPLPADAVASNPRPTTDTTALLLPSEPEQAVSQDEQLQQQQDTPVVRPLSISATDPTANAAEESLTATDETVPSSDTMEPELQQDQQQQEQQRAGFTFLFRRSGDKARFIR